MAQSRPAASKSESVAMAEGFATRCSPFGSCTSIPQAWSNVSLRESGHFPRATDLASRSRFCGLLRSLSTPRCRAAATNASASSTPWFLARTSLMFRFDNGSRRSTVTVPSGETSRSPSLSFAANQSLHGMTAGRAGIRGCPASSQCRRVASAFPQGPRAIRQGRQGTALRRATPACRT